MFKRIVLIAVVAFAWLAPTASASIRVTPRTISAVGGTVTVHLSMHAKRCVLRSLPSGSKYREGRVSCHKPIRLTIKANHKQHALTDRVLLFTERHHRLRVTRFTIYQRRAAAPKPVPCTGWLICDPAPLPCTAGEAECYEPEPRTSFPSYGNNRLGDCPFAAIADWLIITEDIEAPESEVIADYNAATAAHMNVLEWWTAKGLDGTYGSEGQLWAFSRNELAPSTVREALIVHKALVVTLANPELAKDHAAVIDGFTPVGPLIVTWQRTVQMTWEAWALDAMSFYAPIVG